MLQNIDEVPNEYAADALKVLNLKFVRNSDEISSDDPSYPVEYAYQQFGDNEIIDGYKELSLTLCYTEATMFPYLVMTHKGARKGDIEPDNVENLIKEHLVYDQRECLTNVNIFEQMLRKQSAFKPPGKEVPSSMKHSDSDRGYALFRLEGELSETEKCYLERIQSVLYFYIEKVSYTDSDDPKFVYYVLYETFHIPGETGRQYRVMGYCSLYKYYYHPDQWRLRAAHTFVFPQFRGSGVGNKFLHAINRDVKGMTDIYDITMETPAFELILARDYTSVLEVIALPDFTKATIQEPLTKAKKEFLRKEWKMYNKQALRTFDILQLAVAQRQSKEAVKKFTDTLSDRIKKPFERKEKDYRRMVRGLDAAEMDAVNTNNADGLDADVIAKYVQSTIEEYQKVIDRLLKYSAEFQQWL